MKKLRHISVIIPDDKTDSFVNCKLDRRKYADVLTSIVSSYDEGFVLAINNKWGTGKTTFINMWRQDLKNNKYKTLYFNAWKNDFQEEVIISLLSELQELKPDQDETFNTLLEKTATFMKRVAPAIAKGAASVIVGSDAVSEVAEAVMGYTTEQVEEQVKAFNEKKKGIEDFRDILEDYANEIDPDKPVVFFIDELDRCKPSYAVDVLEQIKHLFSVPGIVFVLSIDKVQLGHAICGYYGSDGIDSNEYLRRFFDLEYVIPEPNRKKFIEYLYGYYGFNEFMESKARSASREFENDKENLNILALLFFNAGNYSLREIERTMARIRVALRSFTQKQAIFPELLIFLSYLLNRYPIVYESIKGCKYKYQELVGELDKILIPLSNKENYRRLVFFYGSLLVRYRNEYENIYRNTNERLFEVNEEGNKVLKVKSNLDQEGYGLINTVVFYSENFYFSSINLSYIIKKLELTENLQS